MGSKADQDLNELSCSFTVRVARCWVRCRKLRYGLSVIGERCSRVRHRCSSLSYQERKLSMALLYRRTVPGARSLARKSANHNSSEASIVKDAIRVLLAFFRLFLFFHLFFCALRSIPYRCC